MLKFTQNITEDCNENANLFNKKLTLILYTLSKKENLCIKF
jgi:hypothetical protein